MCPLKAEQHPPRIPRKLRVAVDAFARGSGSSRVYDGTNLAIIDLEFEQYCEGGTAALRGDIYWDANDATSPPGPDALPAGLWEPAAGLTPDTGNYVYLESQPGDFIGQGNNWAGN